MALCWCLSYKETNSQIKQVTYGKHHVKFALAERLKEYDKFIEKVLVNHTNTGQSWFYVNPKIIESVVVESVSSISYFNQNVSFSYQELKKNWANSSWRQYLSSVYGVYVITDAKTGKLYVGSAYGDNGVYGKMVYVLK